MKYMKIEDGVIVQIQPNESEDFVPAPEGAICGMLWDGVSLSIPDKTEKQIQDEFRYERDRLLTSTDFMMTVDYYGGLTETQATELTQYRQDLRDATDTWVMPEKLEWI